MQLLIQLFSSWTQAGNGSLFPAAVVSLYCAYLAYSALQSEPHAYACNSLGARLSAASGSTLALGMVRPSLRSEWQAGVRAKDGCISDAAWRWVPTPQCRERNLERLQ